MSFKDLGLSNWLIRSLHAIGVNKPSTIQQAAIPAILELKKDGKTRRDVFACARTGSGKTLAYVLPILELLVPDPRPYFALILAPTRELAFQINEMIKTLSGTSSTGGIQTVKTLLVIGGGKYGEGETNEEFQGLWFGKPNVVVATPGRMLEQLEERNQLEMCGQLRTLRFDMLVLDEADQLISSDFAHQVKGILDWIDKNDVSHSKLSYKKRQTLVLSATLTTALEQLEEVITRKDPDNKPCIINLLPSSEQMVKEIATNPHLDQRYILCPEYVRAAYLVECILDLEFKQMIIFCSTKREARLVYRVLIKLGFAGKGFCFDPVLLNSDMKQHERFAALERFKLRKSRILVTTDLANRGLDIPLVDLVINYTCPKSAVAYVHRVGRTCRTPDFNDATENDLAKLKGKAVTLLSQFDINLIKNVESLIGLELKKEDGIEEDNITKILKKVALAVKTAEIGIDFDDNTGNKSQLHQKSKSKRKRVSSKHDKKSDRTNKKAKEK